MFNHGICKKMTMRGEIEEILKFRYFGYIIILIMIEFMVDTETSFLGEGVIFLQRFKNSCCLFI